MYNLKNKNEQGITLIALIITIIVLLILAGITIATLSGDNGIINNAIDSQVETELSQLQEKLNRYKLKNEGERIGEGDYSGEMSNDDLIDDGILKKVTVKQEDMKVGIIYLDKLGEKSNLGNNATNINVEEVEKLTDLDDVFVIDLVTNDIYYIKDGKYWMRDGEGQYIYNSETGIDYEGPQIIVTPDKYDEEEPIDIEIKIEKGENELAGDNKYEYYLSGSNDDLEKGKWIKYTSGEEVKIGEGLTGEYYLYVKQIKDDKDNVSIGGKVVIIDGEKYHRFGKYVFDSTVVEYQIAYELNGGTVEGNPSTYTNETETFKLKNPTKIGYTFTGWTGSNGEVPQTEVIIEKGSRGDREYIANWQINSYTVTYDYATNGGTSATVTSAKVNYEAPIDLTPTATKAGYTFVGWNTNKDATEGITELTMGTENVTLYAIYSKTIVATFKYYNNQTSTISRTIYNSTANVTITTPTIANVTVNSITYTGRGWSTATTGNAGIAVNANSSLTLSNSATYYASYQGTVKVTYNANSGSGAPAAQSGTVYLNYAGAVTSASITITGTKPTRANYAFQNWNTTSGGTGTTYSSGGKITFSTNVTLYAIWKGNPTLSITKQPSALTVVAGNKGSFSVTATGNGTLSYQWYYNTSGGNSSGTAVSGATGNTYSFTSSSGMNNRYYYCTITCTVGGVTKTVKSNAVKLTVQAANYSTLKSGTTTYYNTLESAINGATSGGGDSGGGTITVLNSLTDNSSASTNKTITIYTNGKTLKRNANITTTGGTLTVKGPGTLYCDGSDAAAIRGNGGNVTVSGRVVVQSVHHAVYMQGANGNLVVDTVNLYSTRRSAIAVYGKGSVSINASYVYAPSRNKNGLLCADGSTGAVTIKNSYVGNGSSNSVGDGGTTEAVGAIAYYSTGKLTLNGAKVLAGPYSGNGIGIFKPITMDCIGSASIYACNTVGKNCIGFNTSGVTVNFNSTGYFYCTATYVANAGTYNETFNVTKGHFVSRNNRYMFYNNGAILTSYVGGTSTSNRNFVYLNAYNSTATVVIPNCYYYTKGV